jgi:hypothetical protein
MQAERFVILSFTGGGTDPQVDTLQRKAPCEVQLHRAPLESWTFTGFR